MNKIYERLRVRYPSIYYELQKNDSFVLSNKFIPTLEHARAVLSCPGRN
ncbi:MAG: hypothetical protein Q8877_03000 [Sweet potato little leaf phytoplasma]|nr:hypothetical protein [Sweet potato little leaf phytoplasma]